MLLCAAVSAVLCIVGFYCPPAVFFCGIALIILFFVSLYLRRPAETVVAFILAVTAAGILLTSSRAAELSGLDGSAAKGEFTVVSEPEKHGTANTVKLEATSCDTLKKGTKLICTDYSLAPLEYGNRIQATVSLSQLSLGTQKRSYYSEGIFLHGKLRDIRVEKGNDDPVLQKIRNVRSYIKNTLFSAMSRDEAATLTATLFTLPISIYTFGYVSNVSVFTNLLIDAAAGIALQISAVALALNLIFPYISRPLFIAAEFTAAYINRIINLFGSLPFAVSDIGTPEFYASLLIIISVVAALFAFKRRLDRLKLNEMYRKISSERGRKFRWQ